MTLLTSSSHELARNEIFLKKILFKSFLKRRKDSIEPLCFLPSIFLRSHVCLRKSIMRRVTTFRPRQLLHGNFMTFPTTTKKYWNRKTTIQDVLSNVFKQSGSFRLNCSTSLSNLLPSISLFLPSLSTATVNGGGRIKNTGDETVTVYLDRAEFTESRCEPEAVAFQPFFNCD